MTIETKMIDVNGLSFNVAVAGDKGPLVLLVHGFPEIWYCWRHQIKALAEAGYRVIAPDLRGYGYSAAPEAVDQYTILHLVGDLVGLVHAFGEEKVHLIGHDWGAALSWNAAMMRPDVFQTIACLSVPFQPRRVNRKPVETMIEIGKAKDLGEFYMVRFQEPGVAEAEYEADLDRTFRFVAYSSSGTTPVEEHFKPYLTPGKPLLPEGPTPELPEWLPLDDHNVFLEAYKYSGFRGPVNWYRNLDLNWELTAAFQGKKIHQPAYYITGENDHVRVWGQGAEDNLSEYVPGLTGTLVIPGAGHWVHQEAPEAVNEALLTFLGQFEK